MKKNTRTYILFFILASLFFYVFFAGRINPKFAIFEKRINNMTAAELHAEGLKLHAEGKYQEAIDTWQKELLINHNYPNTINNIGIEYTAMGDFDMASQYNIKAIELDPGFAHAYYSLSRNYFMLGKYEEASSNAAKAIELGWINADVYFTIARAQAHLKNYESAIEAYKKTLDHDPKYPLAHIELGYNYRAAGKLDLAEAEFEQELKVKNGATAAAELALAETQAEKAAGDKDKLFQAALGFQKYDDNYKVLRKKETVLQEILTIDPQYPQAHYQLARLYERWDLFLSARDELLLELEYHPDSENAASRLANLNAKIEERLARNFSKMRFPMKAVVAGAETNIFEDSYKSKSICNESDVLTLTGIYGKKVNRLIFTGQTDKRRSSKRIPRTFDYDVLYTVKGGGLVRAVDVILEHYIKNPALISPSGKITIVKNPIGPDEPSDKTTSPKSTIALWLKNDTGHFIHLADINETKIAINKAVRFSPDEKHLFIVPSASLMSAQGEPEWEDETSRLTSPFSLDDIVLLRGFGENDAVYVFDLNIFTLKKFIDISDGIRVGSNRADIFVKWNPVKFENNIFTADFIRRNPRPANPEAPCMLIVVKADESGKILGKEIKETDECVGL